MLARFLPTHAFFSTDAVSQETAPTIESIPMPITRRHPPRLSLDRRAHGAGRLARFARHGRAARARRGAGALHRRAGGDRRDERFWAPVQQAFTVNRAIINLNNAGVSPRPRWCRRR
jgi:hypothetical protein